MTTTRLFRAVLLLACSAAIASAGNLEVTVIIDTSELLASLNPDFYLEFQLNDGSGTNDANNTATMTNFHFYGGGPGLTLSTIGGASGSLDTSVSISDSEFFNQFYQIFTPGPKLSFDLQLTGVVDAGPQPDRFTVSILDCSFAGIPTRGPGDELVGIDIAAVRGIELYAGDPSRLTGCTNTPGFAVTPTIAPEPAPFWLVSFVAAALVWRRRRAA